MGNPNKHKKQQPRGSAALHKNSSAAASSVGEPTLPVELQQLVLNVFSTAFPLAQDLDQMRVDLQEVKGHLYNRDFASAFGKPSFLQVYALRWSAARALGYADIFTGPERIQWFKEEQITNQTCEHVQSQKTVEESDASTAGMQPSVSSTDLSRTSPQPLKNSRTMKFVCIGGGAGAEVVALAAASQQIELSRTLNVVAIDIADWTQVLEQLARALSTPPPLSAYASEAARMRNKALVEDAESVQVRFRRQDVLDWKDDSDLRETLAGARLCTIMFTLNELFSASLPQTTAFLLRLTDAMQSGSRLIVVDSPGSYSEIKLGKEGQTKNYPMKWLLDHTLLEVAGKENNAQWVKTEDEESIWFRLDQSKLNYPAIDLENMRYQIHVYQKQ